MINNDKHSNVLDQFQSLKVNEVLLICTLGRIRKTSFSL
jgi:hypothetical protein